MIGAELAALAAAGGTAVVSAAGTDAWGALRQAVARWFGRGDNGREQAELERLDRTAAALRAEGADGLERVRNHEMSSWQTRFETALESLNDAERLRIAAALRDLLAEHAPARGGVSAAAGGVAAGGDISNRAERSSLAAIVIHGGVSIGHPSQPDPSQG
ncbi:hypothetical protein [Streptomyces sp. NPDC005784]|uniref:hypothetical protein n=1 Tax=Streptomyces sp. NPDC005784 TaxID=3364731 RepID=UPI0036ACB623